MRSGLFLLPVTCLLQLFLSGASPPVPLPSSNRCLTMPYCYGRLLVDQINREGEAMKNTKVTVTVKYEMVVDGEVPADTIDITDVIRDINAIRDIKIKTKAVRN